ncbi:glycoside-pentoside-hexuronide (GPH):cation symporter [Leuconostoc gelidum subsp. gasicomitatum]|uniref:glycoside-pentoside-hexuronide (GPH):cation symporter n=1 Tax=Leuconostoc gasicomitatum TaxID=115778 RepID=UPI001CC7C3A9|nr:glycoside-pentoside-hexuronide (GPH):cation symporter [Leuconostoc gasicomitatum]MBZ5984698.1 glycoside-pentoside-hexuronide (GPH):cation symporter [Leuconostoc gasicomitatum]
MKSNKQSMSSRMSYAFGAFGNDVFFATLSTYFIMFVTTHLFNSGNAAQNDRMISIITLVIFLLRFVELAIDPFIGNAIDNTVSRWGKFKPWVVIGGTVGSIALVILFTNMGGLNKSNPIVYLVLFALIYITMDIFYSFKDIGFWSMIPALTFDSREREKTATFARIGSTLGANLVGVVVMPLVLFFSLNRNGGTGDTRGWFWFAVIVAGVAWISSIVVGIGTKEVDSDLRKNKEKTSFKNVMHILTHNDQLMWIALAYGLYTTGITLVNSLELYYFTFILGNASAFTIFAGINVFTGLISVALFPKLADKLNRRSLFFWCILTMTVGIILFVIAGTSLPLVILAAQLFAIPQPLVFLVVLMTISDSVEYGQLKLGHRDESLTLSVRPLLDKLAGAISNGVVGLTAVAAGMTTGATAASITGSGQLIFKVIMFGVPFVVIILGTFVFYKKVTLTEKKHAEIVDQLEKTWGKEFVVSSSDNDIIVPKLAIGQSSFNAPIAGKLIALSDVKDKTFSSGSLGDGFGIIPSDGRVYAPFDGIVRVAFSTRHAVGLVSDSGVVTLIHIGIGTVAMRGTGFITYFERGQHVKKGDLLIEFWDKSIKDAGFDDTVIVTITNSTALSSLEHTKKSGSIVDKNDIILHLSKD